MKLMEPKVFKRGIGKQWKNDRVLRWVHFLYEGGGRGIKFVFSQKIYYNICKEIKMNF